MSNLYLSVGAESVCRVWMGAFEVREHARGAWVEQVEPGRGGVAGWLTESRVLGEKPYVHFAIIYAGFDGCAEQRGGQGW